MPRRVIDDDDDDDDDNDAGVGAVSSSAVAAEAVARVQIARVLQRRAQMSRSSVSQQSRTTTTIFSLTSRRLPRNQRTDCPTTRRRKMVRSWRK